MIRTYIILWFLVSAHVHSGRDRLYFVFIYLFFKWCPIAATIAGSIAILPCCVVNDFFYRGVWRLPPSQNHVEADRCPPQINSLTWWGAMWINEGSWEAGDGSGVRHTYKCTIGFVWIFPFWQCFPLPHFGEPWWDPLPLMCILLIWTAMWRFQLISFCSKWHVFHSCHTGQQYSFPYQTVCNNEPGSFDYFPQSGVHRKSSF